MTERLLQFIWQFQYYNNQEMQLRGGENLQILHPGHHNIHQGPDFIQARIKIDEAIVAGSIELHVVASDWQKHRHDSDDNFRNVILHVVWEEDKDTSSGIPVFELQNRVPRSLIKKYEQWMAEQTFIPCNQQVRDVNEIVWRSWKDRLLAERLSRKSSTIQLYLQQNSHHWDETFWWLLARHFGTNVNASAFEEIARSIPVNLLGKNKSQIHILEALLLGQAGLLNKPFNDDYPQMLKAEYQFLCKKYKLPACQQKVFFLRMRPINFPTIRLSQLAMLIHQSGHLFAEFKNVKSLRDAKAILEVTANDYWHYHYVFDESSSFMPKRIGEGMVNALIINTICPLLFAYGQLLDEKPFRQKALVWLEETASEKNSITDGFKQLGIDCKNACDSQAFIELKTNYCDKKHCLDCSIGVALLKNASSQPPFIH